MSFYEFLEYFTYLTICEISTDSVYNSISLYHDLDSYIVVSLEVFMNGEYSLSLNQKDKHFLNTFESYDYSPARVIFCKEDKGSFEYICGIKGCERNLVIKKQLKKGKYFVFVMIGWQFDEREFVFSAYGPGGVGFEVLKDSEEFLENVYKNRAVRNAECLDYESQGLPQCYKYHEMMPEGFGYYYIINKNPNLTLNETTFFKKFQNLTLLPPYSGVKYTVSVLPNSEKMILLKTITLDKHSLITSSIYSVTTNEILIVN